MSLFDNSKFPNKSLGIPLKASKKKELKRFLERKKVNRNYRTMWRENSNRWLYMTKGIEICKANEKFYPSNLVWLSVHHTYELQACFKVSQFQACLFIILVLVKYTNKCMLNLRKLYVSKKKKNTFQTRDIHTSKIRIYGLTEKKKIFLIQKIAFSKH